MEPTTTELAANIMLSGPSNKEKEAAFKACANDAEHERQTILIGQKIQDEIVAGFELAGLSPSDALATPTGKELALALGPRVMMSQRDQFFVEQISDRYQGNFGDLLYYTRERDVPIAVISASPTDGGAPMSTNPLLTQKGSVKPIQVIPGRLLLTFEYDNPKLAESNASSRSKAIDQSRYQLRKAMQDLVLVAWKAGQFTAASPFPADIKHDLPEGREHPLHNTIDLTGAPYGGKLTLDGVRVLSDYFDTYGFSGQKMLFVAPSVFNNVKTWASTSTRTDMGAEFAKQVWGGAGSSDMIQVYDVIIVKKFQIADNLGLAIVLDDAGSKTLGVYQFGSIQTLPNPTGSSLRYKFDMVVPGICGVNHDPIRCAFVKFA